MVDKYSMYRTNQKQMNFFCITRTDKLSAIVNKLPLNGGRDFVFGT